VTTNWHTSSGQSNSQSCDKGLPEEVVDANHEGSVGEGKVSGIW